MRNHHTDKTDLTAVPTFDLVADYRRHKATDNKTALAPVADELFKRSVSTGVDYFGKDHK